MARRPKRDASLIQSLADLRPEVALNVEESDEDFDLKRSNRSAPASVPLSKTTKAILPDNDLMISDEPIFFSEALLNDKERQFYLKRRKDYLQDFTFNMSSDIGLIHRVVMEEIIIERLYTQYINEPTKDLSEKISESLSRYKAAQEALGTSRDKRIKNRETGAFSIADLARTYYEEKKELIERERSSKDYEEELIAKEMEHSFGLQLKGVESTEKQSWEREDEE